MDKNYKEYVAIISQSSTGDPTSIAELVNDFGNALKWERSSEGVYELTSGQAETFPQNKTITNVQKSSLDTSASILFFGHTAGDPIDETKLTLSQFDADGAALEGFQYLQVTVKTYNKVRR